MLHLLTADGSIATFNVTGAWRSWLSRWPVKPEAAGSSPVAPALFSGDAGARRRLGGTHGGINRDSQRAVAQLVARSVRDRKAGGSNPPSPIAYPFGTSNKSDNGGPAHQLFQSSPLRNSKAASRPDARCLRIALYWPPLNRPTTGEYCESITKPRGESSDAISRKYSWYSIGV